MRMDQITLDMCKFGDDWPKLLPQQGKFEHENRRPTMTSRSDVIGDVIIIKNAFSGINCDGLFISDVKMNLTRNALEFQNGRHFEVKTNF